jgi:hypothetical protein
MNFYSARKKIIYSNVARVLTMKRQEGVDVRKGVVCTSGARMLSSKACRRAVPCRFQPAAFDVGYYFNPPRVCVRRLPTSR